MSSSENKKPTPAQTHGAKRLARLASVQALYQAAYDQESPVEIVRDYVDQNFPSLAVEEVKNAIEVPFEVAPDVVLFKQIVLGVSEHQAEVDEMLVGALSEKLSGNRMELLLRSILRAGVFEMHHHASIPAGVIINDYVDVTRAFFNAKEPGLINAVLDKIAQKLRH